MRISDLWKQRMLPAVHKDNAMYCSPPNTGAGDLLIDCGASTRRQANGVRASVDADRAVLDYRNGRGVWVISPERDFYTRLHIGNVGITIGTTPLIDESVSFGKTIDGTARRVDTSNLGASDWCALGMRDFARDMTLGDWWTFEYRVRIVENSTLGIGIRMQSVHSAQAGDFSKDLTTGATTFHADYTQGADCYFSAKEVDSENGTAVWHVWLSWKMDATYLAKSNGVRPVLTGAGIVEVYECQLHRGFGATQFFNHSGANAMETRTAGALSDFNSGVGNYVGSGTGSWFLHFAQESPGSDETSSVTLYETRTDQDAIVLHLGEYATDGSDITGDNPRLRVFYALSTSEELELTSWNWFGENKVYVKWDASGFKVFCNGVEIGLIAQTPETTYSNLGLAQSGTEGPDLRWAEHWLSDRVLTDSEAISQTIC